MKKNLKIIWVHPGTLKVPDVRITSDLDEETDTLLFESIKKEGVKTPIQCSLIGEDLVIVDGFHRAAYAQKAGIKRVPVFIMDGGEDQNLLDNLILNRLRGKTKPSEMVKVIEELDKKHGLGAKEISEKTGLSLGYIRKLMLVSRTSIGVREALDQGRINVTQAFELARLEDHDVQERVLYMYKQYEWNTNRLREQVSAVIEELQKPPQEQVPIEQVEPPKIQCSVCGGGFDVLEVSNPTICKGCWGMFISLVKQAEARLESE